MGVTRIRQGRHRIMKSYCKVFLVLHFLSWVHGEVPCAKVFIDHCDEDSIELIEGFHSSLAEYNQQCGRIGAPRNVSELCDINLENHNAAFHGCSGFRDYQMVTLGDDDWSGEIHGLESWDQCRDSCNNNPECGYWVWVREERRCRLEGYVSPGCYSTISPGDNTWEECQLTAED